MLLFDRIVGYFAPHICIGCGKEGSILCAYCLLSSGNPPPPRCAGCKALSDNYKTCHACRSWLEVYAVYVATEYGGVYERLLKAYKFQFKRQAAEPIAQVMHGMYEMSIPIGSVIIPLPTASSRVRSRGFDHVRLIVKIWFRLLNPDLRKHLHVSYVLKRKSNSRQVGASREQRIQQVMSEFYVSNPSQVRGRPCVVVDDVTTTGSSLAAAAKTLKQAGATRVYAIVYAQKI